MIYVIEIVLRLIPRWFLSNAFERRVLSWAYGRQARKRGKVGRDVVFTSRTRINGNTKISDGCVINGMEVFGTGEVSIGECCHFGADLLLITCNHDYDTGDKIPYGDEYVCKSIVIGPCVWIGRRVTILPGAHIGEGAIIQAGAVVHGEIPAKSIAGGNPAKVFAMRDVAHYDLLKSAGKFKRDS